MDGRRSILRQNFPLSLTFNFDIILYIYTYTDSFRQIYFVRVKKTEIALFLDDTGFTGFSTVT